MYHSEISLTLTPGSPGGPGGPGNPGGPQQDKYVIKTIVSTVFNKYDVINTRKDLPSGVCCEYPVEAF